MYCSLHLIDGKLVEADWECMNPQPIVPGSDQFVQYLCNTCYDACHASKSAYLSLLMLMPISLFKFSITR